jgi:hypothetical protein
MNDEGPTLVQSLQKALLGAVFPLSSEQLVLLARENEAPSVVLSLLSGLPRQRFDSLEAVGQVLAARSGAGEGTSESSAAPMQAR